MKEIIMKEIDMLAIPKYLVLPDWCLTKPRPEEKRVIIFHEEYSDRIFRYFNEDDLDFACLEICNERVKTLPLYNGDREKPEPPEGISDDNLHDIPKSLKEEAERKLQNYKSELEYWEESQEIARLASLVSNNKDAQAARKLLEIRRNYEDEKYSIKPLCTKKR